MANLKADSPLCRRIVHAFLQFLNSVEPASGVDLESLEVAKECLSEAFKIEPLSVDSLSKSDSLIDIFSSRIAIEQREIKSDPRHEGPPTDAPSTSSAHNVVDAIIGKTSQSLGEDQTIETHILGTSEDELFGHFFAALEKIHYFKITSDGQDDQVQLDRATHLFHNALMELQKSGCQKFDQKNLADTFKSQGNKAMQSKLYSDAIELYTVAIALCDDNAVYYCNRAAAYTQIYQYMEAIQDCYKSIRIDPTYSKAYSRLGFVYYAQGNYRDAINKGFLKALLLDPNNNSVKENIQVAEQKLREEQQRTEHGQNSRSQSQSNQHFGGGSRSYAVPSASMTFNINGIPVDMASMLGNMTTNVNQGQHTQERSEGGVNINGIPVDTASVLWNMTTNVNQGPHSQERSEGGSSIPDTHSDPEIRIGGNISVNLGDQMPQELSGALRSVMEMFSGAAVPNGNADGGSAPS